MISIIIPIYNEEQNIVHYHERLFSETDEISKKNNVTFEYIFVDDGSADQSVHNLNTIIKSRSDCHLIRHDKNRGMGAAIKTGFAHASGDCYITMDSDLTFRPSDIQKLLEGYKKSKTDCVSGSPYLDPGLMDTVPIVRKIPSYCVNFLYRLLLKEKITCVSPIFRLYRAEIIKALSIQSNDFSINAEIISKLLIQGKTVLEVPVELHTRDFGESKINTLKEVKNNIKILIKIFKVKYFRTPWA